VVCIVEGLVTGDCVSIGEDGTAPTKAGRGAGGCETTNCVEFLAAMNSTAFGFKGAGIEDDGLDETQAPFAAVPVSQGGSFPGISGASLAFGTTIPKWPTPGRDAEFEPLKLDFSTGE